jgi:thioester reductase-like protein
MTLQESPARDDLAAVIRRYVEANPTQVAYHFVTYPHHEPVAHAVTLGELDGRARQIAAELQGRGVRPGDRVILLSSQTADDVVGVIGCLYARAIFVLLPAPVETIQAERFASALRSSGARVAAASKALLSLLSDKLAPIQEESGLQLMSLGHPSSQLEPRPLPPSPLPPLPPDGLACLQYTSGSTKAPKAIAVSHGNLLHNLLEGYLKPHPDVHAHSYVIWAPFFHNVGLLSLLMPLVSATPLIVMRPIDFRTQPIRWFQLIHQYRAEGTFGPHSAYVYCCKAIAKEELRGLDLSCLKYALNGAEPIDAPSLLEFAEKFADTGFRLECFVSGYGLGECTSGAASARPHVVHKHIDAGELRKNRFVEVAADHPGAKHVLSVGEAGADLDLAIIEPESRSRCARGEIGEICIRGRSVAVGYWNDPAATEETFGVRLADGSGGWLRTGDLGSLSDGQLFVTGRMKEVIIINGHNFYPSDIEASLRQNIPALRESRVVTFAFQERGKERVICCVEQAPGSTSGVERFTRRIAEEVARLYEFAPEDVLIVPEGALPRTPNGKLQNLRTRELYLDGRLPILARLTSNGSEDPETDRAPAEAADADEAGLLDILQAVLQRPSIRLDDNFFLLGGDSIGIAHVANRIRERFGIEVPIKYLVEGPTARQVARLLRDFRRTGGFGGLAVTAEELRRECSLDPTIVPGAYPESLPSPRRILVTGGTGFVGAYLIRDLLLGTDATIFCHVRAATPEGGLARLRENLAFYDLWQEAFSARLVPVLGDLSQPLLGIEKRRFDELALELDVIYHSGALLNFVYPYSRLKATNVGGTEECLRLACAGKAKLFHHVSSFSVFDNPSHFDRVAREDDPLSDPAGYLLGYSESKWVAEKLVRAAFDRGLQGAIYRLGEVSGSTRTGICKTTDAVIRLLMASIQAGVLPEGPRRFHLTPVDYVSRAVVALSVQPSARGRAFHIINANVKTHGEVASILRSFGYAMDVVPFDEWQRRLFALPDGTSFKPLESLMKEEKTGKESMDQRYGAAQPVFDVSHATAALEGTGIECPPVDRALIETYLRYMRSAGHLPAPPVQG